MADGAGLVYNKRDNTGAAAVLTGSVDMKPLLDVYKDGGAVNAKDRKPDQALAGINSAMAQAWDNDLPELQEMYNQFTGKLKDYEQTRNQKERRDKWYDIQNEQFALRTYINKSAKNRAAFEALEKKFSSDDRYRYGEEEYQAANKWRATPLKDRSDYPDVKAATTQSALAEIAKLTKYKPDTVEDKFTSKEGPGKATFRTIIDRKKLKEAVRSARPLLAKNMQYALNVEMQKEFLDQNPLIAQQPLDVQKAEFDNFIEERVVDALLPGYANNKKDVITLREYGKGGSSFAGGAGRVNKNGIWSLKRISQDGKYFISVQPNKSSGIATPPTDEITITGKDFKNLYGQNSVGMGNEKIKDDGLYKIQAKLEGIVLKEGEKPSVRLQPVDPTTGALKQGIVKEVALTNDNEQVFLKYGDDYIDFFHNFKPVADRDWDNEKKPAPRTGTSVGAAPKASPTAPAPAKQDYAPKGLPPVYKPIKNMSKKEYEEYTKNLTPAQKHKALIEKKKR
jgi:hypothetical protein